MNLRIFLYFLNRTQYVMELTFTQAAKGVNKEISVNIEAACQRCDGKGHEPGTKVQHCHYCNGSGMVRTPDMLPFFKVNLCHVTWHAYCLPFCRRPWTRARLWCAPHVVSVAAKAPSSPIPVTLAVGGDRPSRRRLWWFLCQQVSLTIYLKIHEGYFFLKSQEQLLSAPLKIFLTSYVLQTFVVCKFERAKARPCPSTFEV